MTVIPDLHEEVTQASLDWYASRILTMVKYSWIPSPEITRKLRASPDDIREVPISFNIHSSHSKRELASVIEDVFLSTLPLLQHFRHHFNVEKSPELELKEERDELLRKTLELQKEEEKLELRGMIC